MYQYVIASIYFLFYFQPFWNSLYFPNDSYETELCLNLAAISITVFLILELMQLIYLGKTEYFKDLTNFTLLALCLFYYVYIYFIGTYNRNTDYETT